jgi:site-specific DNA-methyltransferase (adenine-specific)
MEVNKIHNINFLDNTLPDKCANLIIADPPYFEVKGDFDFIWKSFNDYLQDVEKWAIECKRLLADNGTLFWYGMDRKIAYAQIIFDKHFHLLGTLVWEKPSIANEWDTRRTFPERGQERILMYCNQEDLNLTDCVFFIRDYIRNEITKAKGKIIFKEVNKALGTATNGGGVASACLSLDKTEPAMITEEMYNKLQKWCNPHLNKPYDFLRKEYEELRKEYEDKRRPFNNYLGLTDVLRFSRVHNAMHPTQKPEDLTRSLILTCSRPNDFVVVPFAGSGTECAMSVKEGRKTIGFEITEKHAKMSNDRVQNILRQPSLFLGS